MGRRARNPLSARSFVLWHGVLGPPAYWAAHLVLGDLSYELGCARGVGGGRFLGLSADTWSFAQAGVLLGLTVLAGVLCIGAFRRLRQLHDGTSLDRAQAMAVAGIASAAIYGLLIAYGFLPSLFLRTCGTSL